MMTWKYSSRSTGSWEKGEYKHSPSFSSVQQTALALASQEFGALLFHSGYSRKLNCWTAAPHFWRVWDITCCFWAIPATGGKCRALCILRPGEVGTLLTPDSHSKAGNTRASQELCDCGMGEMDVTHVLNVQLLLHPPAANIQRADCPQYFWVSVCAFTHTYGPGGQRNITPEWALLLDSLWSCKRAISQGISVKEESQLQHSPAPPTPHCTLRLYKQSDDPGHLFLFISRYQSASENISLHL